MTIQNILPNKKINFIHLLIPRNIAMKNFLAKPKKVVNLAAQAGVRYSIENPYSYLESNLIGTLGISAEALNITEKEESASNAEITISLFGSVYNSKYSTCSM